MRNLKRALSLALASVMLLGMMVVGAGAASYPDVDANDNVEAIEVLNAIKVMIGKQGNFEPDSSVNRHEMAVIMAKLVLGNEAADNYVGTHPYTDVAPWADKYVAACYENGLTSGTSATTYGGQQSLTAVQAAAMMLRALGYKDLSKGATDWRAPVTAAANRIRLFADVASNPSEKLTRNQVAQLALNTLKSPMVDTKDGLSIVGGNGDLSFTISGDREYVVRSSTNYAVSGAIMRTETAGSGSDGLNGYAVELGEHLYNGKLRLIDSTDDFGRPSRQWEYDGKKIGTYAKEELIRATYTEGVKGGKIYDDIGSEACGSNYSLDYWVDGIKLNAADTQTEKNKLVRRNDVTVGPADGKVFASDKDETTARGVLTQVFVNTQDRELTIVEIHTFLAQAIVDYNTTNESLNISVYTGRDAAGNIVSVSKRLELEDFPSITGYKKDDYMMVTMAGPNRDVQTIADPVVVSDAYVSAYSSKPSDPADYVGTAGRLTQVTADGKEYKISAKAYHDPEYLYDYSNSSQQLDGYRYDLLLDSYGYLLGIKNVTAAENVFFVVGYNPNSVNWGNTSGKAFVIFPDGTSKEVTVKGKGGFGIVAAGATVGVSGGYDRVNAWYDYTVDADGTYVISNLSNRQFAENRNLTTTTPAYEAGKVNSIYATMSSQNVASPASGASTSYIVRGDSAPTFVYGNDNSVYIAVKTKTTGSAVRIDEVNGVTTGIKNVNIDPRTGTIRADGTASTGVANTFNVFGLYDKNGYVTYAVVIGEDGGAANNMVYLTSGITGSYYDSDIKKYVYQYDAINADSNEVITVNSLVRWIAGGGLDENTALAPLSAHTLYKATYDAKGFITKMEQRFDDRTSLDNRTGPYNTQAYKDNGYGTYTLAADGSATKVTLSGNTLYLSATNNNQYVLITGDTKFFVNGKDDTDGKYNLYPTAASALAALGNDNQVDSTLTDGAKIAIIADKNTGFAKTVIFRDQVYAGANVSGPQVANVSSAYVYDLGSNNYCVRVKLTANETTAKTLTYRVIGRSIFGTEVVAATGTVTTVVGQNWANSATIPGGVIQAGLVTYYVEINGVMYNIPGPSSAL